MKTMTEPATDRHLDELSKRVDFGFDQTSQRLGRVEDDLRALRTETKAGFDRVHDDSRRTNGEIVGFRGDVSDEFTLVRREASSESIKLRAEMKAGFDGLQRQMTRFFAGTLGTIIAGVIVSVILSHL
jgi:hypothetical protein